MGDVTIFTNLTTNELFYLSYSTLFFIMKRTYLSAHVCATSQVNLAELHTDSLSLQN